MTTHTKRRGRRSLAAILAAMLMASVLAVVAGSPAQAANTSSEVLIDHDGNASTDKVREFGGIDRYDTALRLAKNFGKGDLSSVPEAYIASGYTLVDAVAVSGLAGHREAPVLLTPMDSLHRGVADFIEDYGVNTIHVLGGSAAVSDAVVEAIEALGNKPTVKRIEGADRYATAAAIASQLGGGTSWCGTSAASAILVNGGDVSLAEAMMVGPIAYRLQLPVLMTAADMLPDATSDFIADNDIEHVQIVGGTGSVSEDVAKALTSAGVDTVARIGGATPAETSVALMESALNGCGDDLGTVASAKAALVHENALPDGVAASPVLASNSRLAQDDLIPILVVGDTLPAAVEKYLNGTPQQDASGQKVNYELVAIGGPDAVSPEVMDAALAAAASADALTVQIGNGGTGTDSTTDTRTDVNKDTKKDANDAPQVGDNKVVLYFSDNVNSTGLTGAIRDILEINGVPAGISSATHGAGTQSACDPDTVTVHLSKALKANDTISVVGGAMLGNTGDNRKLAEASLKVEATPVDRTRPTVSLILIAGQSSATITTDETGTTALATGTKVTIKRAGATTTTDVTPTSGLQVDFTPALAANDRVTISSGAVVDSAGNKSLQRSFTASAAKKSPSITSVTLSTLKHSKQASAVVPADLTGGEDSADNRTDDPDITITAKADGAAAGAVGNAWSIVFDRASTYDATKALDISVRVSSADNEVSVRFNNGKAKFADLKAALEGNSAFDALFAVKIDADPASVTTAGSDNGKCGTPANKELQITRLDTARTDGAQGIDRGAASASASLSGGVTEVAIEVRFNGYISAVDEATLLDDVLSATLTRAVKAGADPDDDDDVIDLAELRSALKLDDSSLAGDSNANPPVPARKTFSAPGTLVRYEAETSHAVLLPKQRDLVVTLAARLENTGVTPTIDAVAKVADGYADDDPATTDKDESDNGDSQVRIGQSSTVKQP